ncbi:MAG: hypothetical protein V2J10_05460 [Wenzhouxiangella sp.]|jgi:hypothetical protein|nr:hypothetical protein [Wenzhouxiangella sp.]
MLNLSFKEKSTLGTLIAILLIGALYFRSAWAMWQAGALQPVSNLGLATGLTILLVIVLIGYHILVALLSRPEQEDERDRLITWRAGHIGGIVLGVGVIGVVLQVLIGSLWADPVSASPVLIVNALMAVVFVATIVELSVALVFYRRGL